MQIQIGFPEIPPTFPLWLIVLVVAGAVLIALFKAITEWQITERTKATLAGLQLKEPMTVRSEDVRRGVERELEAND